MVDISHTEPAPDAGSDPPEQAASEPAAEAVRIRIRPPASVRRRPRLVPILIFALVTVAFYLLCLANSDTTPWDADTSAVFLQGWDLVHGHLLLHGWWSSDVNFYTFDAPIYGICGLIFGMGNQALHIAGAVLYTLVFLSACWAVRGGARGAKLWLRISLVALFMTAMLYDGALRGTLLLVPDHTGTCVFILAAFVLYDRHAERRWAPWAMLALLTLGQLGDATIRYMAVPTLIAVWLLELVRERRLRTPRGWMIAATAASVVLSMGLRDIEKALGAYHLNAPAASVAPVSQWNWHISGTYDSLLSLFGVPSVGFLHESSTRWEITIVGGIALIAGAVAVIAVVLQWTRKSAIDRLIVVGAVVYLAEYCFSTMAVHGGGGGYEFVGIVPLFAVLSARNLTDLRWPRFGLGARPRFFAAVALTVVASLGAAGCLISGSELEQTRVQDQPEPAALWLEAHGLKYGLAGYWDATPMTVYSGDKVKVRAALFFNGAFMADPWGSDSTWYEASKYYANFVVTGGVRSGIPVAMAEESFGTPAQTYQVGTYTILVYNYNLLDRQLKVHLPPGA